MDCDFKYQWTLSIIRRVKISKLTQLAKIFWSSHSSTIDLWWVINPKPCKNWVFLTHGL
jgi:hypothetical protein